MTRKVVTNDTVGLALIQSTNEGAISLSSVPDDGSTVAYTPTVPGNWPVPPPTTVQGALDATAGRIQSWHVLYEANFSTLGAELLDIDGAYVIAGRSVTKQGSAYGSATEPNQIVPGSGLTLHPNMLTSTDPKNPNDHRPALRWYLNDLLLSQWPHARPLRVTAVISYVGANLPNQGNYYVSILAQGAAFGRMGPIILLTGGNGNVLLNVSAYAAPDGNYSLNAATNAEYLPIRVMQIEMPLGVQGPMILRGAAGIVIPDPDSTDWIELGTVSAWSTLTAISTYVSDPTAGHMTAWAIELGSYGGGYESEPLRVPFFKELRVEQYS